MPRTCDTRRQREGPTRSATVRLFRRAVAPITRRMEGLCRPLRPSPAPSYRVPPTGGIATTSPPDNRDASEGSRPGQAIGWTRRVATKTAPTAVAASNRWDNARWASQAVICSTASMMIRRDVTNLLCNRSIVFCERATVRSRRSDLPSHITAAAGCPGRAAWLCCTNHSDKSRDFPDPAGPTMTTGL